MPAKSSATHNQESLKQVLARVKESAIRIDAAIMHVDLHGIESLEVTNQKDLISGLARVENFTDALHKAVRAWLHDHGRFEAETAPKKSK